MGGFLTDISFLLNRNSAEKKITKCEVNFKSISHILIPQAQSTTSKINKISLTFIKVVGSEKFVDIPASVSFHSMV